MKTTKTILNSIALVSISIAIVGCNTGKNKDKDRVDTYKNGIFVLNEGNFGNGTATVSYIDKKDNKTYQNVFKTANKYDLGNLGQSMAIDNNVLHMVINNANKIEKADLTYFGVAPVLKGFNSPRAYAAIAAGKAYVAQWGNGGKVMVVNTKAFNIVDSISVGAGAENIIVNGNLAYVACNGAYGYNNNVAVINTDNNKVVKNLTAGPSPESLQIDAAGNLWVLCQGAYNSSFTGLDSNARLVKINLFTDKIEQSIDLGPGYSLAHDLKIDNAKSTLYFVYSGKTYSMPITASTPTPLINRDFYSIAIDPSNGQLVGTDAVDYVSNGKLIRYNANSNLALDSFTVGIIPGDIIFN